MTGPPVAHVGGIPIEETIGFYGPAILLAFGAASASIRTRLRRWRGGRASDRRRLGPGHDRATSETFTSVRR